MGFRSSLGALAVVGAAMALGLSSVSAAPGKKGSVAPAITYDVACDAGVQMTLSVTIVDDVEVAYYFSQLQGSNALPIFVIADPGSQTVEAQYTVGFDEHILFAAADVDGNVAKALIVTPSSCTG